MKKLGLGKRLLPGCIPAVYKFRAMARFGNFYEWFCQVGRGFLASSLAHCLVKPLNLLFWREKTPGSPLLDGFQFVDGCRIMSCTKLPMPLYIRQPKSQGHFAPSI